MLVSRMDSLPQIERITKFGVVARLVQFLQQDLPLLQVYTTMLTILVFSLILFLSSMKLLGHSAISLQAPQMTRRVL